jgi:hypothetical protein
MADRDPAYVAGLATQLRTRHPGLTSAENELQTFRTFKTTVARFINNPAIALDVRQGLARDLRLPEPTT